MSSLGIWTPSPADTSVILASTFARGEHGEPGVALLDAGRLALVGVGGESWLLPAAEQGALEQLSVAVGGEGRIDNAEELAELLGMRERRGELGALLTAAYRRWGDDCWKHVLGEFAFTVWDRDSRRLSVARDAIGVRPLYYVALKSGFAWSTNLGLLQRCPGVSARLDPYMVVDYLCELPGDEERTLLLDVRRVPAGSVLTLAEAGAPRVRAWHSFDHVRTQPPRADDSYAEGLRELLRRATSCRLPRGTRAGVLLSGGLDSSTVTATANEARLRANPRERLLTVSAIFDGAAGCDERSYQRELALVFDTEHVEYRPSPGSASNSWEHLSAAFAQPRAMGPHWLAWPAAEEAAQRGVRTLFTGIDGDRVISHGEGRLTELARSRALVELARECWLYRHRSPVGRARLLLGQSAQALVPLSWLRMRDAQRDWAALGPVRRFIRAEALHRADVRGRVAIRAARPTSPHEAHYRSITDSDRTADLEVLSEVGRAWGIEFLHPFYDLRIVEFCLSLPADQKRRGPTTRVVLRNAMRGLVPDAVRLRTDKAYFDRAFREWALGWLRTHGGPNPAQFAALDQVVDVGAILTEGRRVIACGELGPTLDFLWRSVILSRWLEGFVRGFERRPAPLNVPVRGRTPTV